MSANEQELFKTKFVNAKEGSGKLFDEVFENADEPVTCLGMEFENDDARRKYFTEQLREKLKYPEFRQIEGFPIGEDEDILALSDPPYYTACPNPWINDFINEWDGQKSDKHENYKYHREPFAADVSEGKNDPIYKAHSYHTKVPHKAIMRYLLHYTEPGDIVFDSFCGTGMTAVAAQMCGNREIIMSLGYQVKPNGTILQEEIDENGEKIWGPFSKIGARKSILNDLSPAATFIAYNYNMPVDVVAFETEAIRIIEEIETEYGWVYETLHSDEESIGQINYTIWSDVFICPDCAKEIIFWDQALDTEKGKVLKKFPCPHCNAILSKTNMDRAWVTKFDDIIGEPIRQTKQVPVLISYIVDGEKIQKKPDKNDLSLLEKIENIKIPHWFPKDKIMFKGEEWGDTWRAGVHAGITNIHHFYTKRNLLVLAACWDRLFKSKDRLPFLFTASQRALSRMASIAFSYFFHGGGGFINAGTKGTLYVSSINPEVPVFKSLKSRLKSLLFYFSSAKGNFCIENKSASIKSSINNDSIDYIFIDPPFGSNIMYSELNFLWEPWLKVLTNNIDEAIESKSQGKSLTEYRELMTDSFKEAYRVLKPGRWMTVEFSNTKAAVWNNIQTAITETGFVIANVSALDKKQGSFKAYTTPTAVKQDLVISAYKPNGGFEKRFVNEAGSEEGVWDFIRTHLKYLPVIKLQHHELITIPERDPRILFDQVVAYYVRKGFNVPISSKEFQLGLEQRFPERDGMYFLPEQVAEYDKKKMVGSRKYKQIELFVSDESSAIDWLRILLKEKPQSTQDIHPQFIQETQRAWKKSEQQVELSTLLEQNFLCYDGNGRVPAQIHSYLSTNFKDMRKLEKDDTILKAKAKNRWYVPDPNEAEDREKVREKSLLKDFEQYRQSTKKLKIFRLEAMRAGFKKAYQTKDYQTIIDVAQKIPGTLLEEDPKLLMWYDQAVTRTEG